nr:uncharacterized protein LOC121826226 isoform X6 [Peromyscus maniculatus bairdii]
MASTGRSEEGRRKMTFSLHVTHQETNGSGESTQQQLNQVEKLKLQLQMMTNDRNELREFLAHYKNNELNNSTLYSQHLSEQTQLKEQVKMLLEDKKKLQREQILLQESHAEAKRLCEEAHEKIYDLWTRQLQEHQRLEENLQSLLKQKELFTRQRDLAVKLQHHFTVSQMSTSSEN